MLTRRTAVVALGASLLAGRAKGADWWGRRLPSPPTQFIFGYVRAWNDRSPSGFTALGLRRPRPDEPPSTVNGVLYPVDGDDMARFDAQEVGYARVEVPREAIEAVSWQRLPEEGRVWVYVPVRPGGAPGEGLPEPDAAFPLLQSYIDVVVEGALEYGPDYARELIETTADWSPYWLNDRELARRPWVHDGKSAVVDRLLAATGPASSRLPDRMFPEEFAVRWLTPAR